MNTSRTWPALCLLLLPPASTHAAAGAGAISLQFNTSPRSAGMGDKGVATLWGGDTNVWANPAMLAYRPGVRYGTMHSQLAVGFANNIFIDKKELTLGAEGVGLLYARGPIDHVYLDTGVQQGTDENGNPTGEFRSFMKSQSWGLGLSAAQVLHRLRLAEIGRWFDIAAGIVWKDFEDQLAPDNIFQDALGGGRAAASMRDLGWVARVTPVNTLERASPNADHSVGLLIEATYGRAKLNDTDEVLVHLDADQSDPLPTTYLSGWAVHAAVVPGTGLMPSATALVRDALTPLLAFTYSEQNSVPGYVWTGSEYVYMRDESGELEEDAWGYEISFLNTVHIRRGHIEALWGEIDGDTEGWGLSVQAGRYGGVRYDEATVPQARGLPTVTREGWQFWVDALALFGSD